MKKGSITISLVVPVAADEEINILDEESIKYDPEGAFPKPAINNLSPGLRVTLPVTKKSS